MCQRVASWCRCRAGKLASPRDDFQQMHSSKVKGVFAVFMNYCLVYRIFYSLGCVVYIMCVFCSLYTGYMEVQVRTWPLAVFPSAQVQIWHCRLHKAAWLSGKASVETAGSRPLVVSTRINPPFYGSQAESTSSSTICSLSANKQDYVNGAAGQT